MDRADFRVAAANCNDFLAALTIGPCRLSGRHGLLLAYEGGCARLDCKLAWASCHEARTGALLARFESDMRFRIDLCSCDLAGPGWNRSGRDFASVLSAPVPSASGMTASAPRPVDAAAQTRQCQHPRRPHLAMPAPSSGDTTGPPPRPGDSTAAAPRPGDAAGPSPRPGNPGVPCRPDPAIPAPLSPRPGDAGAQTRS